jgi:signal transduction histidine kinase
MMEIGVDRKSNKEATSNEPLSASSLPDNLLIIQRLQSLVSASVAVSSELDLDRVLQRIADYAREFAQAEYAAMGIVDEDGVILSFITSGISKEEREKIGEPPRGHGLLGVLIKQGKALRVRDMTKDPRRSGFPPNHPVMTSLLGVPVSSNNRIVGDLYLTDKIGADEFTSEDEWWVTLFARHAAVAVENANLYKAMRIAHQRSQTLAELAGALNRLVQPEELFEQITSASSRLLEIPGAALFLLDSANARFEIQASVGLQINPDQPTYLPVADSVAGKVLTQNKPVVVPNSAALHKTYFPALTGGNLPSSLMVVPIRRNERVMGVIEVYSDTPRQFSFEEASLLEAFAGYASLALEKAQIYQAKEEFLSMTAHDLRAPLAAIKMSAGLLETNLPPGLPPALERLVNNIGRNSERLNNLLNDLLDLTRLEQGRVELNLERLELGETVAATAHPLTLLFENKGQELLLERPGREYWVNLDRRRFEQALVNLLTNANKYTPENGKVRIGISATDDWVLLAISDNGPGIPAEEQAHIFDRYYRRPTHEQSSDTTGTGLGLPIARSLIQLHGGQLWVESEVGKGSTFFIKLPLETSASQQPG